MREELGIDESAAVRGAQRPAQGPTQRERRSAPRIRFAKQSLRKAALWALSAWNASAHALPAYSWAPIVPISYAMLANFTVHGCACSGVSNPYGFGAYCARWETPTQNPWCYVLADCPTGGAAGDYGKFEDCAEAPSPWSEAAADAAEATVDAAALQPLAAAAATSFAASAADASAAAAAVAPAAVAFPAAVAPAVCVEGGEGGALRREVRPAGLVQHVPLRPGQVQQRVRPEGNGGPLRVVRARPGCSPPLPIVHDGRQRGVPRSVGSAEPPLAAASRAVASAALGEAVAPAAVAAAAAAAAALPDAVAAAAVASASRSRCRCAVAPAAPAAVGLAHAAAAPTAVGAARVGAVQIVDMPQMFVAFVDDAARSIRRRRILRKRSEF